MIIFPTLQKLIRRRENADDAGNEKREGDDREPSNAPQLVILLMQAQMHSERHISPSHFVAGEIVAKKVARVLQKNIRLLRGHDVSSLFSRQDRPRPAIRIRTSASAFASPGLSTALGRQRFRPRQSRGLIL
jgi:hypothetical protein